MDRTVGYPVKFVENVPHVVLGHEPVRPLYETSWPPGKDTDKDTSASPTPAPPEVRTETCTLVLTDEFRTASASVTVTSRGRNGARAVSPVHTVPPVYCGFVTVAVTVTSQSCVTAGAVHVDWNLPFASVTPVVGF